MLLQSLAQWLERLKLQSAEQRPADTGHYDAALDAIAKDLKQLDAQEAKAYDLVEQGVYTTEIFLTRTKTIAERRAALQEQQRTVQAELRRIRFAEESRSMVVPRVQHVLDTYWQASNTERNIMLKEVLDRVVYTKTISGRWAKSTDLNLELFPKMPSADDKGT